MARGGKLGWFLGLIFGTVFGVLFAPRKGKELRAKMKADRRKGRLGVSPLRDDLQHLGHEIAALAKKFYESETVQDIVVSGRKKMKDLSKDLVGEVNDFHYSRIQPLRDEVKERVRFAKGKASHAMHELKKKVKKIKHVMKKKHGS